MKHVLLLLFAALLSGCNTNGLSYVSGKVLIDGQPAPEGLIVQFQPQDTEGSPSSSFTDKEGKYELWFSRNVKGVQPGPATITVSKQTSDTDISPVPEYLKAFNRNSPAVYDVKKGNQIFDIAIDSSLKLDPKFKKKRR